MVNAGTLTANEPHQQEPENRRGKPAVLQQGRRHFQRGPHHALHPFRKQGIEQAFDHQNQRKCGREVSQSAAPISAIYCLGAAPCSSPKKRKKSLSGESTIVVSLPTKFS